MLIESLESDWCLFQEGVNISVRSCTYWREGAWPQKWAMKCCKLQFWVSNSSPFSKPGFSLPLSTTVGFKRPSPSHFFTWWPTTSKVHLQSLQKPCRTSAFQLPHKEEGHTMMAWPPRGHQKPPGVFWRKGGYYWSQMIVSDCAIFSVRNSCCPSCESLISCRTLAEWNLPEAEAEVKSLEIQYLFQTLSLKDSTSLRENIEEILSQHPKTPAGDQSATLTGLVHQVVGEHRPQHCQGLKRLSQTHPFAWALAANGSWWFWTYKKTFKPVPSPCERRWKSYQNTY